MGYDFTKDVEEGRASVAAYWRSKKTKETEQGAKSLYTGTLLKHSLELAEARDAPYNSHCIYPDGNGKVV